MVEGGGFEPPKLARQIYSLIPLATREPLPEKGRALSALALPLSTYRSLKKPDDLPGPCWSWREESNPRPADYKSAALPTELHQLQTHPVTRRSILVEVVRGCNLIAVIFAPLQAGLVALD